MSYVDMDYVPTRDCEPDDTTYPGTPERVEIYRQRADAGLPVFHRLDRTLDNACCVEFKPETGRTKTPRTGRPRKDGTKRVTRFVNHSRVVRGAVK